MFNHIIIVGRLGFNPSFKETKTGTNMCQIKVAVDNGWGQSKTTDWYNVTVFGKVADACHKLSKGDVVCVSGTLTLRTYDGKDGQKKSSLELTAQDIRFLTPKANKQAQQQQETTISKISYDNSNDSQETPFSVDNDIPF